MARFLTQEVWGGSLRISFLKFPGDTAGLGTTLWKPLFSKQGMNLKCRWFSSGGDGGIYISPLAKWREADLHIETSWTALQNPNRVCVSPQVPSILTGEPTLVFQIAFWSFLTYNKNDDTAYDMQMYTRTPSTHMDIILGTSTSRTLHCSAASKTLHLRHWPTGDMSLTKVIINSPRVPAVYRSCTECFMHHDPPLIEKLLSSLYYKDATEEQGGETTHPSSPDVKQSRDGLLDPLYSWASDTIRNTVLNPVSAFQDGCY